MYSRIEKWGGSTWLGIIYSLTEVTAITTKAAGASTNATIRFIYLIRAVAACRLLRPV
jgi:hypothetical protein